MTTQGLARVKSLDIPLLDHDTARAADPLRPLFSHHGDAEKMSVDAARLPRRLRGEAFSTQEILSRRHGFHVKRIAARAIPAQVIDDEPCGDRPNYPLVGESVRWPRLVADREDSVSSRYIPMPRPAFSVISNVYLRPEAAINCVACSHEGIISDGGASS